MKMQYTFETLSFSVTHVAHNDAELVSDKQTKIINSIFYYH
jgi:hypothetical protein